MTGTTLRDAALAAEREPSGPYLGPNPDADRGTPEGYGFH